MKIKQNDLKPYARTTLWADEANEIPADVSSGQVDEIVFNMKPAAGALKVDRGIAQVVTDGTDGQVEYRWVVGDTDTPGIFSAEFEVVWADTKPQSFPPDSNLSVEVVPELG